MGSPLQLQADRYDAIQKRKVVLGIRPEDLRINTEGSFSGDVDFTEPMGAEIYVHLVTAVGNKLVSRAPGDAEGYTHALASDLV